MVVFSQWQSWLRELDALAGLPMMIVGLAVMLGGWRLGQTCVVLTLAALGGAAGVMLAPDPTESQWYAAGAALLMATVGVLLRRHAVALLGGLLLAAITREMLFRAGLRDWALWIAAGLTFMCGGAVCLTGRQTAIIVITSLVGGILLVSGLVPLLSLSPPLYKFLESTSRVTWAFFPFLILVPSTVGYFLQLADSRRRASGSG